MAGIDCSRVLPISEDCECQCPDGGWCEPHQIEKTAHYVKLCRTREPYRRAWNECRGPRQGHDQGKTSGPGAELCRMIGCDLGDGRRCVWRSRFTQMNDWGADGCILHMSLISGWMKELHIDQKITAERMVYLAIKRANKRSQPD